MLASMSPVFVILFALNIHFEFLFLDAIASPSSYPCQSVGQSVGHSQFQIWR